MLDLLDSAAATLATPVRLRQLYVLLSALVVFTLSAGALLCFLRAISSTPTAPS